MSFLGIFLAWEQLTEDTFLLYLLGKITDSGYAPRTFVTPRDGEHAADLVKGGRAFTDWTTPGTVKKIAELFFENGMPYTNSFQGIEGHLNNMKLVRNAIAHKTKETREKYETFVRRQIGYVSPHVTPGEFLATNMGKKSHSFMVHFRRVIEFASDKIVP